MTDEELLALARGAGAHAHAPYSGYRVGAALLSEDGSVVTAANVENASYGLTLCAERAAFAAAVGRGLRRFRVMAVAADGEAPPYPCGACLQVAQELAPEIRFVIAGAAGSRTFPLRELLPHPFGLRPA